jgi:drug/metabolite transporter (DMT)-like permease
MESSQNVQPAGSRKWMTPAVWVLAAAALLLVGQVFALNGDQWDWWRGACWAAALVAVASGLFGRPIGRATSTMSAPLLRAIAAFGVLLILISLLFMRINYSDPYAGSMVWPRVLAVVGFLGFSVACLAVTGATGSRRSGRL